MTALPGFTATAEHALPLHAVTANGFAAWSARQSGPLQAWLKAQGFTAAAGTVALLPGSEGLAGAVLGIVDAKDPFSYAHAPYALPVGDWRIADALDADATAALQLGWGG